MLPNEADWLGARMAVLPRERLFPLVNLGSSTAAFRERDQPWIHASLFAAPKAAGEVVVHVDLKADDGVDLVGDLADPEVLAAIRARAPRSVLCSNLLEHIERDELPAYCDRVAGLVGPGGYLLMSVPRAFPYHPDPIDTLLRPSVPDLIAMFPGFRLVAGEEVIAGRVWGLLRGNVRRLAAKSARLALGRDRARQPSIAGGTGPSGRLHDWVIPWAWRPFVVTCVVLERP